MGTVTTSIGSNSSIDTETPSSCADSGPWVVTFGTAPTGVSVGDLATAVDGFANTYIYLVTVVDGGDITMKYISGGMGATSPCSVTGGFGSQSPFTFKRYYATITLWEAGLDDTGLYSSSDDAVGECYDDSAFDEAIAINGGGTVGLSSVTLSVASGERHDGTAGNGARIVKSADWSTGILYADYNMPVTLEWLEINAGGYKSTTTSGTVVGVGASGVSSAYRKIIRNMLIHDANGADKHMTAVSKVDNRPPWTVMNNIIYDISVTSGGRSVRAISTSSTSPAASYIYNNTVYKLTNNTSGSSVGITIDDDADEIVKNNIVCDVDLGSTSGTEACYSPTTPSNATAQYNLSSDSTATGTGSLTSKTAGNQFVNTANGSEDLHLKDNADALRAGVDLGTTPSGVEIDIDGRNRDSSGDTWDIGADQCATCSTSSAAVVPQTMNTYKQMAGY